MSKKIYACVRKTNIGFFLFVRLFFNHFLIALDYHITKAQDPCLPNQHATLLVEEVGARIPANN